MQRTGIVLDRTFKHTIENVSFSNLPIETCHSILKDGRAFSHFIEKWLEQNYQLKHVQGCKKYDFEDLVNSDIKYDEKTFTHGGCSFCPSNMLGQGRTFDKTVFEEKTKHMIFVIVSNIHFPNIFVRFVNGSTLLEKYPNSKGKISFKDHDTFFELS